MTAWVFPTFPSESQKIRYSVDTNADGALSATKTLSSATILTFSVWIKIQTSVASARWIIGNGSEFSGDYFAIRFTNTTIVIVNKTGATTRGHSFTVTNMNNSAWHHIFVQLDTTQVTDTNRVKVWLDNVAQTPATVGTGYFTASQAVANADNSWNAFKFVSSGGVLTYVDIFAAVPCLVDGLTVDITRFIRNTGGGLRPVRYCGPYGTQGFKFEFLNTSDYGADSAGHGSWTVDAGFTQITDTPSG